MIILYPNFSESLAKRIENKLKKAGIKELISYGKIEIKGFKILGKGTNSIVVKAIYKDKEAAVKIIRTDATRKTLLHEANILKKVNVHGIGPKLYYYSKYFLILEYIEGLGINDFIEAKNKEDLKKVIIDLLNQCRILDKINVDHGELSRPNRHVLITRDLKVKIIDFESASMKRNTKNVTSILSYLFFKNNKIKNLIKEKEKFLSILRNLLSNYKINKSDENFSKIMDAIKTYL